MARYKVVNMSPRLLSVDLDAQLIPGSFAHAVRHFVDTLDLSLFDAHYRNDEVGASAHAPTILRWWHRACAKRDFSTASTTPCTKLVQ